MSSVLSALLDNISFKLLITLLSCFSFCLPFLSRLDSLTSKPPILQLRPFSSTYLIMHHKRKQKFSLIVKPQLQNQAHERNLMITDRITLTDAEWNDRQVPLQKPESRLWNFMFRHCMPLVRSVLSFDFPISVMKARCSLIFLFVLIHFDR